MNEFNIESLMKESHISNRGLKQTLVIDPVKEYSETTADLLKKFDEYKIGEPLARKFL